MLSRVLCWLIGHKFTTWSKFIQRDKVIYKEYWSKCCGRCGKKLWNNH